MNEPKLTENIRVAFGDELVLEREVVEDGKAYKLYCATYTADDGQDYEVYFHAESREDAEDRAAAMRDTLELDGEWGGSFTQEQSN